MALYDKECILSDAQAITATANSTNTYDFHGADLGRGEEMQARFLVTEAFTATGAGTLTVSVVVDDNTAFTSGTTIATGIARSLAQLTAGTFFYLTIPPYQLANPAAERYMRFTYTVGTGPMTAGKITADIGPRMRDDSALFYPQAAVANA